MVAVEHTNSAWPLAGLAGTPEMPTAWPFTGRQRDGAGIDGSTGLGRQARDELPPSKAHSLLVSLLCVDVDVAARLGPIVRPCGPAVAGGSFGPLIRQTPRYLPKMQSRGSCSPARYGSAGKQLRSE